MKRSRRSLSVALLAVLGATLWVSGAGAASKLSPAFAGGKLSSKVRRVAAETLPANGGFEGSLQGWAGYRATLSLVAPGASGANAARVSLKGTATDYSIFRAGRIVSSATAGSVYSARAWVRSATPGRQVCLRIREWAGETVSGSAKSCVTTSSDWKRFPALAYKVAVSGHAVDVYAYGWRAVPGDSFDLDDVTLSGDGAAPAQTPPPPP
ncbi:MAG: hypothetical protein ABR521_05015, partial [Gaiellaceae bacterium]